MNEMLTRLQRGESVDALASELTRAINEANNRYLAEQEAKRKAEAEAKMKAAAAEAARNDKVKAIDDLLAAIEEIIVAWEIDSDLLDEVQEINAEELVDELDRAIPALQEYARLVETLQNVREKQPAPAKDPTGDPIEKFLNQFVR